MGIKESYEEPFLVCPSHPNSGLDGIYDVDSEKISLSEEEKRIERTERNLIRVDRRLNDLSRTGYGEGGMNAEVGKVALVLFIGGVIAKIIDSRCRKR